MEKFPALADKEKKSPQEKHGEWLKGARVLLEGTGVHVVIGVSTLAIFKGFGINLSPEMLPALIAAATPAVMIYMKKRRDDLREK